MGYYINHSFVNGEKKLLSHFNKAIDLIKCNNAIEISKPKNWNEWPEEKALLCVAENYLFDAVGLAYDEREFLEFSRDDERKKVWLLMDKKLAWKLSNFEGFEDAIKNSTIKWK